MQPGRPRHPRQHVREARRDSSNPALRALIYSPNEDRASAIAGALDGYVLVMARGLRYLIDTLIEDPPPRPQVLVVDVDLMSPGELLELHAVRDGGWCGHIIAIGEVPLALRRSLGAETVLDHDFRPEALYEAVSALPFDAATIPLPVLREVGF